MMELDSRIRYLDFLQRKKSISKIGLFLWYTINDETLFR
jgi:hypothetical protein